MLHGQFSNQCVKRFWSHYYNKRKKIKVVPLKTVFAMLYICVRRRQHMRVWRLHNILYSRVYTHNIIMEFILRWQFANDDRRNILVWSARWQSRRHSTRERMKHTNMRIHKCNIGFKNLTEFIFSFIWKKNCAFRVKIYSILYR